MVRALPGLALVLVAASCADSDVVGAADARPIFDASNGEVHELHLAAFELAEWPATYAGDCVDGGRIDMETVFDGAGEVDDLLHVLVGCAAGGYVMDGRLDYLDVEVCDGGSYTFRIEGELTIDGVGTCAMAAAETCGVLSGTTCGYALSGSAAATRRSR